MQEPSDYDWMEMALREARLSEFDVPVGCVIVRDGELIASGHNEKSIAKIQLTMPK